MFRGLTCGGQGPKWLTLGYILKRERRESPWEILQARRLKVDKRKPDGLSPLLELVGDSTVEPSLLCDDRLRHPPSINPLL